MSRLINADGLKRAVVELGEDVVLCDSCFCEFMDLIDAQPTIKDELVRHGHWILPNVCYEDIECSVCHAYMPIPISFDYRPLYKYCPMCGAKMYEVTP